MIDGLGVAGWGVGGIEAEAAMLGQVTDCLISTIALLVSIVICISFLYFCHLDGVYKRLHPLFPFHFVVVFL